MGRENLNSKAQIQKRLLEAKKRSIATQSSFDAMLDKKTKCATCSGAIDREDRACPKCSTANPYWMH